MVVEWGSWGGGSDKGSCGGQIGGVVQLSSGSWGGNKVSVAAAVLVQQCWCSRQVEVSCVHDGMAMLHCHPIIVQGEWKDENEKEKLIKVCCKACMGGCSRVVTVLVGG